MFNRSLVFGKSFNTGKCKTLLRLAISRIKLLRNKRDIQLKQMKRDLAQLLQNKQDLTAHIRVEHVYREQNIMATYEIIELFCELLVVRLPIIESQRLCPIDLKEAVASLAFAAPRCAELPELQQISSVFASKYGKDFVSAAAELRPECGVNRLVIEKLSVRAPSEEVKLKLMKDIALEQGVEWDAKSLEAEVFKLPPDLLNGTDRFSMDQTTHQEELRTGVEDDEVHIDLPDLGDLIRSPCRAATSESYGHGIISKSTIKQNKLAKPHKSVHFAMSTLPTNDGEDDSAEDEDHNSSHSENFCSDINKKKSGEDYKRSDVVAAAREAAQSAERAAAAAMAVASSLANSSSNATINKFNTQKHSYSNGSSTDQSTSGSEEEEEEDREEEEREERGRGGQIYNNVNGLEHWQQSKQQSKEYFRIDADSFESHIHMNERPALKSAFYDDDVNEDHEEKMNQQHQEGRNVSYYNNNVISQKPIFDEDPDDELEQYNRKQISRERMQHNKKSHDYSRDQFNMRDDEASSYDDNNEGIEPSIGNGSFKQRYYSPPKRSAPPPPSAYNTDNMAPHVHPKLPDYDDLSVRFQALRSRR